MTIDERLAELKGKHEMLSDRHNALVESIELSILDRREEQANWLIRYDKLLAIVERVAGTVDHQLQIAELHQHRLDSLNDRLDKLEGTT